MDPNMVNFPQNVLNDPTHLEFALAIASGILIAIGWLSDKMGRETLAVTLFIASFLIGGFFKAREGIRETIKNKTLNVEILMILAAIGSGIIGYWEEGA